jgi:hypothetical protein
MFCDWHGRPALWTPGRAVSLHAPGAHWARVDHVDVGRTGQPLPEGEFWRRFADWQMPRFPEPFAERDRRRGATPGPLKAFARP